MKEYYEWSKSWSDCAPKSDLPRVLLVGDSITDGYQACVREALRGRYYVDAFVTSYAVDSKTYHTLLRAFIKDNHYDIVHYNHGLHGKHMSKATYEKGVMKSLKKCKCRIILALTTEARSEGNERVDESWAGKIAERNEVLRRIAAKYGYGLDDLYTLSTQLPVALRERDGVHFAKEGYERLGELVVDGIVNG